MTPSSNPLTRVPSRKPVQVLHRTAVVLAPRCTSHTISVLRRYKTDAGYARFDSRLRFTPGERLPFDAEAIGEGD